MASIAFGRNPTGERQREVCDFLIGSRRLEPQREAEAEHQDQRQRSAVAQFEERERILVHPVDRRERFAFRVARCHDLELVEGEHRADDADQCGEEKRAVGERQDDPPDPLPVTRAVDHRRLVDLGADRLDARDEQDHPKADDLPDD